MFWVIYWDTERREWCASAAFDTLPWAIKAAASIGRWKTVREAHIVSKVQEGS